MSRSCWCSQAGHQMSLCVEHMACCLFGAMCSHVDCLSPLILLLNHCFSGSSCVSLVTLVCLPMLSPCVCSPVLIRCLSCVHVMWVKCLTVLQSSACLLVFPPSGVVYVLLFNFVIKNPDFLCIWVLDLISRDTFVHIMNVQVIGVWWWVFGSRSAFKVTPEVFSWD